MKWIGSSLIIAVLARLSLMIIPFWWGIVAGAAIGAFMLCRSASQAALCGFTGLALLWGAYVLPVHIRTDGLISGHMAGLTGLPGAWAVLLLSVLLGGMLGAVAAWSGFLLKKAI